MSVKRCDKTLLSNIFSLPATLVKSAFKLTDNDNPVFSKHNDTSDDNVIVAGRLSNVCPFNDPSLSDATILMMAGVPISREKKSGTTNPDHIKTLSI